MPAFILYCLDKPDAGALRAETRERHLEFIADAGDAVLLAGPMLDDTSKPIGSLLIIDVKDENAAQKFAEDDPYAQAELFQHTDIRPYRIVTGALAK